MNSYGVTIQMKPVQQYFHMVLFVLYVVLTFESVNELLWCYHSNETCSAVLSHGTICFVGFYKTKFYCLGGIFLFRHQKERMGQYAHESVLALSVYKPGLQGRRLRLRSPGPNQYSGS